jgi:hypothetical protein
MSDALKRLALHFSERSPQSDYARQHEGLRLLPLQDHWPWLRTLACICNEPWGGRERCSAKKHGNEYRPLASEVWR